MKSAKICLLCAAKRRKYYDRNSTNLRRKSKRYYKKTRADRLSWQKNYYQTNIESRKKYNKKYYQKHKEDIIKHIILKAKQRRKNDPVFRLRKRVSADVWRMIKTNGGTKNGSVIRFLPFSIKELKEHLEKQFEPWMNWSNWGVYRKDIWDDNDSTTWTWQIDHIIPHCNFQYSSMKEQSFLDCWSLTNLRPISSKENLEKNRRIK
jgi:hypothetical protein